MNRFYKLLTVALVFFVAHNSFAMKGSLSQQSISKKKAVTKKVKPKVSKRSDVRALAALKRKEEIDYSKTIGVISLLHVPYLLTNLAMPLALLPSEGIPAARLVEAATYMTLNNAAMSTFNHCSTKRLKNTPEDHAPDCHAIQNKEITRQALQLKSNYARKKALACLIAAGVTTAKASYDLYRFYNEGDIPSWINTANFGLNGVWLLGSLLGSAYHLKESCK